MKRILITGKNSYIGSSVENWLNKNPEDYYVESLEMKDGKWKEFDFSSFDVVFHVAGIAHVKETKANKDIYFKVNRDLAYETAKKSKSEGVKQFIFLSTMSVYGITKGTIYKDTPILPKTAYGKSKKDAEELINKLNDFSFAVAILRPPMVYGKGSKGNYQRLSKMAQRTLFFPKINNKRSMIYIKNLAGFVQQIIDKKSFGMYLPQNKEYVNVAEMVYLIADIHNHKLLMTSSLNKIIRKLNINIFNKVFSDLYYENSIADKVNLISFAKSIEETESKP